jgi:hypothetical protein
MSVAFDTMLTSESSGGPGTPAITLILMNPTEFAAAPFASGEPTVNDVELWTGGLHDGNASGVPCVRFGDAHALYAGTTDARSGVAPFGRGCVALAAVAITIIPSAAMAITTAGAILFLILI